MREKVFCFIPGILNNPADEHAFTDEGVRWVKKYTPYQAIKCEYFSGVIFRRLWQAARVRKLHADLLPWVKRGAAISLVGHSNGCDIIARHLKQFWIALDEVHLVAGACERDCELNGINRAMECGRLERASVYCSERDGALKLARNTGAVLKFFGLGYGTLGLEGPEHVEFPERVRIINRPRGHREWFGREHFDETMRLIVRAA